MGIMYMAQTSNPYYRDPNAADAITAIVMAVVLGAIIYFVVVVVTEIVVLYNEASREAALKRGSMKRRSSAGKTAGEIAAKRASFAALADGSETPNIGAVSNETNPMFLAARGGGVEAVDSAADAIMATKDAPSQSMWVVFQQSSRATRRCRATCARCRSSWWSPSCRRRSSKRGWRRQGWPMQATLSHLLRP